MFRRLSTYYVQKRKSITSKVIEKIIYVLNKLSILLHIILKCLVIFSVYERRPPKLTAEMVENNQYDFHNYCNTIIALLVSCVIYSCCSCCNQNTSFHILTQNISFIINSIIFTVFWWTIIPHFLHRLPWCHVYLAATMFHCLILFTNLSFYMYKLKSVSTSVYPIHVSKKKLNKSVNVSVAV